MMLFDYFFVIFFKSNLQLFSDSEIAQSIEVKSVAN